MKKPELIKKTIIVTICIASSITLFAQDVFTSENSDETSFVVQEVGESDFFKETTAIDLSDMQQQSPTELILPELKYKNGIWQNGVKLSAKKVRETMAGNNEALQLYNSGKSLLLVGQIIGYPSAFLFGFDLGTRTGGGKGNTALLIAGGAGTAAGLIMMFTGEGKMKTSVQLYNSKVNNSVSSQLNFGFTQTGIGLSFRF